MDFEADFDVPKNGILVVEAMPAQLPSLAANSTLLDDLPIDRSVAPSRHFSGGYGEARRRLERFLRSRLRGYATLRNKPDLDATSQLSPYLHFGHIGAHTIALAVQQANAPVKDRKAYLEELIVRRELAINFVRFNANYENFEACEPWADVTYRKHAHDRRRYLYTERQLENAESHGCGLARRRAAARPITETSSRQPVSCRTRLSLNAGWNVTN